MELLEDLVAGDGLVVGRVDERPISVLTLAAAVRHDGHHRRVGMDVAFVSGEFPQRCYRLLPAQKTLPSTSTGCVCVFRWAHLLGEVLGLAW